MLASLLGIRRTNRRVWIGKERIRLSVHSEIAYHRAHVTVWVTLHLVVGDRCSRIVSTIDLLLVLLLLITCVNELNVSIWI